MYGTYHQLGRLSEDEVLRRMLEQRHRFAKAAEPDRGYHHSFRRKSKRELIRLSLMIVGIECTYATETALVAPILLSIGIPHTFMTMIWALPSLVGLLFAPLIASISDRLRSRWGRRRPVLLVLGATTLTGMMILPNGPTIGRRLLGLDSVGWLALITTCGLVMSDFSVETSNGICRTYAMEVCTVRDQTRVLSMMVLLGGVGATMGALFGAIDWMRLGVGQLFGSNDASVFAANWLVLLVGLLVTLTAFAEIPLPVQECEPMLRPVTQKMLLNEMRRMHGDKGAGEEDEDVPETVGFRQFVRNVIGMPYSMKILCLTQLLSHMSYLTYCLYYTDFVGATVYEGDVRALEGSPAAERYADGVRFACLGMALCSTTSSIYSTLIERLIERFGARPVYVSGLMAHCLGMLAMGLVPHKTVVFLCCSLTGIMYATIYSIPFLLISHYHSKNCFTEVGGLYIESVEKRGFGVDVSMMSSMLCLAQLIVSMAIGAVIDAVGSTLIVTFISSAFMVCAACSATGILYMGL